MTADELVEKVARAICVADPDCGEWETADRLLRRALREEARAAIRAVHEAMREPSLTMAITGAPHTNVAVGSGIPEASGTWRAMLAAHPIAEAASDE